MLVLGLVATSAIGFRTRRRRGIAYGKRADAIRRRQITLEQRRWNAQQISDVVETEGRIIRILERGTSTLVGRYESDDPGLGYVVPFDRRVLADVQVAAADTRGLASLLYASLTGHWPGPDCPSLPPAPSADGRGP